MIFAMMLEPLSERYTAQWLRWIPYALTELNLKYTPVLGKCLTSKIETGSVLDAHGTSYWKATQMASMISRIYNGEVKNGDTIWFADLWNFDVLHLAYIRNITGIKFKISGVLHAGTWDDQDFVHRTGIAKWAEGFEKSLLRVADEIHVGTEFHKGLIVQGNQFFDAKKIKVTGLFFDANEVRAMHRRLIKKDPNLVVFCQRLDPEKKPEEFDKLAKEMKIYAPELKFVKTRDLKLSKDEYYNLLASATWAVSFDGQETFGYTVLECMALGVTPIVPNTKAYKETVPKPWRYETEFRLRGIFQNRETETDAVLWECANRYAPVDVARNMFVL